MIFVFLRIQEIRSMVSMSKKKEFVQRLIAYWTLKRQLRNGVPLLRRLQATQLSKRSDSSEARSQSSDVVRILIRLYLVDYLIFINI